MLRFFQVFGRIATWVGMYCTMAWEFFKFIFDGYSMCFFLFWFCSGWCTIGIKTKQTNLGSLIGNRKYYCSLDCSKLTRMNLSTSRLSFFCAVFLDDAKCCSSHSIRYCTVLTLCFENISIRDSKGFPLTRLLLIFSYTRVNWDISLRAQIIFGKPVIPGKKIFPVCHRMSLNICWWTAELKEISHFSTPPGTRSDKELYRVLVRLLTPSTIVENLAWQHNSERSHEPPFHLSGDETSPFPHSVLRRHQTLINAPLMNSTCII